MLTITQLTNRSKLEINYNAYANSSKTLGNDFFDSASFSTSSASTVPATSINNTSKYKTSKKSVPNQIIVLRNSGILVLHVSPHQPCQTRKILKFIRKLDLKLVIDTEFMSRKIFMPEFDSYLELRYLENHQIMRLFLFKNCENLETVRQAVEELLHQG